MMPRDTYFDQFGYRYLKTTAKGYTKKWLLVPGCCMKVLGEFDSKVKLQKAWYEDMIGDEKMTHGWFSYRMKLNPYRKRKKNKIPD